MAVSWMLMVLPQLFCPVAVYVMVSIFPLQITCDPTIVFKPVAGDQVQLSKPPVLITSKTVGPEEQICDVSLALTVELPPIKNDGPVRFTDSSTSDKFKTFTNLKET